jgi:hypothetical protein
MGGKVGLKPSEIFDLTFSELNVYLKGLSDEARLNNETRIRQQHTQAMFNGLAFAGKLKPVETYLPREHQVDSSYSISKSREISKTIDILRGEKRGNRSKV